MTHKNIEHVNCSILLDDSSRFSGDAYLPPNKNYTLIIDYPLSTPYKKVIRSGRKGIRTNGLINHIIKAYNHVYDIDDRECRENIAVRKRKFGIWGHGIEDLVLCSITVNHISKTIKLGVDS